MTRRERVPEWGPCWHWYVRTGKQITCWLCGKQPWELFREEQTRTRSVTDLERAIARARGEP